MTSVSVDAGVVVGPIADLQIGESRAYAVQDRQVAVFRLTDGTLRATDAVCPHRGGPLADGQFDLGRVVCPLHQYAFGLADGRCTTDGIGSVGVYRVEERDGDIVLWLDSAP
ncbi:Rieske (2Fe-2S) protein [Gordonia terrae]|uniref:Rieske (2Fe-2S) protein n=2 Tax=Gordonia terrae TaxID=2055 RepID=A0AAD0K5C9_9ACTN|nr:Rieske (2Fe-2S) protein [Gordonia terrae]VTR06994.1 3-ketosteroid-9-alpha-hydroxylase oxygenase subunit [Clostridioides difficile]ANY22666.1 2Fe-2S ferredoxin [Gordonia terrae]AWO83403.1 Rieske (2Fe-2S) protein [Gordonia terrae]VTS39509.1 3-ketosteroid-9-alpha-hydroxylase oxygenase subunit [Gordonia terrae]GAB43225.1 nitrite reductase small subunit [Gordonia terrae NBRC 100016]